MGLDQYFAATIKKSDGSEYTEDIVDLRKANAIQNWFIENLWDGEDRNCEPTDIPEESMHKFMTDAHTVMGHYQQAIEKASGKALSKPLWEYEDLRQAEDELYGENKPSWAAMDIVLEDAAQRSEEVMPPTSGFFFGEAVWDRYQYYQLHWCLHKLHEFEKKVLENDPEAKIAYNYDCWW